MNGAFTAAFADYLASRPRGESARISRALGVDPGAVSLWASRCRCSRENLLALLKTIPPENRPGLAYAWLADHEGEVLAQLEGFQPADSALRLVFGRLSSALAKKPGKRDGVIAALAGIVAVAESD